MRSDSFDYASSYGWDHGIEYDKAKKELEERLLSAKNDRDRAWYAIFLIQLENGSRIGEAVDCARQYVDTESIEQRVRVQKRSDDYLRLMIIPEVLRHDKRFNDEVKSMKKDYTRYDMVKQGISRCRSMLGYNTHSHRYAFIGNSSNEMPVQLLARITGHKTIEQLYHYTQAKAAEAAFRERF